MDADRNAQVLDGMKAATRRIGPEVTSFAESMRALDIRVGMHNYVGFDGEAVLLVVAREGRAGEVERLVDGMMGDEWQADSSAG